MKYIIFCTLLLLFIACKVKNPQNKTTETAVPDVPTAGVSTSQSGSGWKASQVFEEERADTESGTKQHIAPPDKVFVDVNAIAPPNTSRRTYLATGWWTAKMAFRASDTTVHKQYLDKFLKFNLDQTFEIIKDKKTIDTGKWNYDEENLVIYLSCTDPYFNNTWKVRENGFRMVWIGQTDLNRSGIQVRMDNWKALP